MGEVRCQLPSNNSIVCRTQYNIRVRVCQQESVYVCATALCRSSSNNNSSRNRRRSSSSIRVYVLQCQELKHERP